MTPTNRKLFYFLLSPILGKKIFQNFFELLYLFSLAGMNYGMVVPGQSGERFVLKYINSKIKKSKIIIFDIGANKGNYTENILQLVNKKVLIFDFEPLKEAALILKQKFAKNKNIKIFNIGFSNKTGKSIIHFDEESSELASLYKRRMGAISLPVALDKNQTIALTTIDLFCSKHKIRDIDLLKIDTEGHELKVLEGARNMIKLNKISYIQFEFGGTMIDSRTFFIDIFSFLSPTYSIYRILQDGLHEIKISNEKNEIFIIGNFLAIRKDLLI